MKLHGLLQKCSFFFRFDWTLAASGGARMKLQMSMGLIKNVVAGFIPA
jgi:hypothetical protein